MELFNSRSIRAGLCKLPTSEARVNRRPRRYYLVILLLSNVFTLTCLLLSSIQYDTGHLMMV